ncbi:MAG TPA: hypothetical protein VI385_04615 [Flavisolibacter sp.]
MKKTLFIFGSLVLIMAGISSCTSMKKDCQGRRHYRTANGIYV